jgi:hypothetical protein
MLILCCFIVHLNLIDSILLALRPNYLFQNMKKVILISFSAFFAFITQAQNCSDVFISEIVEGWSNNKAVELYNPTADPIDLDEYGLVRFQNGSSSYGAIAYLTDITINPYDALVVVLDKRDTAGEGLEAPLWDELWEVADIFMNPTYDEGIWPMYFNGDDAIALVKDEGETLVDLFGRIGEGGEFGGWGPYGVDDEGNQLYMSEDHTLQRKNSVQQGVTSNPGNFDIQAQWDTLPANTFDGLGIHSCLCFVDIEEFRANQLNMYPNPVSGNQLWVEAASEIEEVKILDLNGRLVFNFVATTSEKKHMIDLTTLASGMYVVEIHGKSGVLGRLSLQR